MKFHDGGIVMNFYTWMMKKHLRTKDPVGDLARDMQHDKEFPHDGDHDEIRFYLEWCSACTGCLDAFERAWKKYGIRALFGIWRSFIIYICTQLCRWWT